MAITVHAAQKPVIELGYQHFTVDQVGMIPGLILLLELEIAAHPGSDSRRHVLRVLRPAQQVVRPVERDETLRVPRRLVNLGGLVDRDDRIQRRMKHQQRGIEIANFTRR